MSFTILDYLQGGFSFIFVLISIIIGLKILTKYFEYKKLQYILVGLVWIGLATPWFPDSINFIMVILFQNTISDALNFIIGNSMLPLTALFWLKVFTDLTYKEKQKVILSLFIIYGIIFEILLFTFLFIKPSIIGSFPVSPFQIVYHPVFEILLIVYIITFMLTGVLFARESLRLESLEMKLKGKFLIIAFISFTIGAFLDSLILRGAFTVILTRLILISASIEFYFGFILQNWVKNLFIKSS